MDDEANCPVDQDGDDGNQEMEEEEEEEVEDEDESQNERDENMFHDDDEEEMIPEEGEMASPIQDGPPGRFFEADHQESFDQGEGDGVGFVEDGEEVDDDTEEQQFFTHDGDGDEGGVEEEGLIVAGDSAESSGEVPPDDSEEMAMMHMLLPDSESLYDPSLGFESEANIKTPMIGFSTTYQDYFFPLVDSQSGILFEIVQEVERAVYKSNEDVLRGFAEPVAIPTSRLSVKTGGPEIRLRIMDPSEPLVSVESAPQAQSSISKAAAAGWQKTKKSPESIQMEKQITPAEKAFSAEKLEKLMVPFTHGWKREIVIRSHGGGASKKLGDVYYFSPQGVKYRSSKQVALYLNKHQGLNMSTENFSFAKARVSYDPESESVRAAQGGRGLNPIKNQQGNNKKGDNMEEDDEELIPNTALNGGLLETPFESAESDLESVVAKGRGGRRSIQPPKRYATAEFIPEVSKRAKMSQKAQDKDNDNYSSGGMEMGMLHPKYRGIEMEEEKTGEQMLQEFRARRGRPPKSNSLAGSPQSPQLQHHHQVTYVSSPQRGRGRGAGVQQQFRQQQQQRDDGPMFGISALTQGAQFSNFSDGMEYNSAASSVDSDGYEGDISFDQGEEGNNKTELLPCSIRCPGMTGEVPTLQCKRCLCLYHPGCLGLPNQPYRNFFCSNCEGDSSSSVGSGSATSSPMQKQQSRVVLASKGGMRIVKRSEPPGLIQLNSNSPSPGGRGGGMIRGERFPRGAPPGVRRIMPKIPMLLPGQRPQMPGQPGFRRGGGMPQMFRGINPPELRQGMPMMGQRRGRGRPPGAMGMATGPNMTRGSVTITPISIPRGGGRGGQHPVVPMLQPLSTPSSAGYIRGPGMRGKPGMMLGQMRGGGARGGGGGTRPQMVMNLLKRGGLAPRPRAPSPGVRLPGLGNSRIFRLDGEGRVIPRPSVLSGLVTGLGNSGVTVSQNSGQFQRFAQSVVTINQKKYLALPKNSSGAQHLRPDTAFALRKAHLNLPASEESSEIDGDDINSSEEARLNAHLDGAETAANTSTSSAEGESAMEMDLPQVNSAGLDLEAVQKKGVINVLTRLPVADRIRAREVSQLWKSAVDESGLWSKLALVNIRVTNWNNLQEFVLRHQVTELDTRGALISNMEEFWQQLLALDYNCHSAANCYLKKIVVSNQVSEWSDGSLLKEFQDTGSCEIVVINNT